ncbi:MAG: translocation/assembly module TamB [Prevotella sp.]|nr:translocation/assembly module TamB [Candidatus Prevotella equi]
MVWTCIIVYASAFVLLKIPAVQGRIGAIVSDALCQTLGTNVEIGNVDIRLFNRVITDDVLIYDQQQKQMLRASRISATVELLPLLHGEVNITSAQLFGIKANLYKKDSASPLNCQFVIDSLASKDTTSQKPLNLSIASLIIRNGSITYDQYDKPRTRGSFSPYHVNIEKLSSHLILYKLTDTSLNVLLKRLTFNEVSGFTLKDLHTELKYSKGNIDISDFMLSLQETSVSIPQISVRYAEDKGKIREGSLKINGKLNANRITPSDFSAFLPDDIIKALPVNNLIITAKGTDKDLSVNVNSLSLGNEKLTVAIESRIQNILTTPQGSANIRTLHINEQLLRSLQHTYSLPEIISRIGDMDVKGNFAYYGNKNITAKTDINATKIGTVSINGTYKDHDAKAAIKTESLNLQQLLADNRFGTLKCDVDVTAHTDTNDAIKTLSMKGNIGDVTYNGYTYHDIKVDGNYDNESVNGQLSINDPNIILTAQGTAGIGQTKELKANISINDFSPRLLNLSNDFGNDRFSMDIDADMRGKSINDAIGELTISNIVVMDDKEEKTTEYLSNISITSEYAEDKSKVLELTSDFAHIRMQGNIIPTKIPESITNIIVDELPSIPGLTKKKSNDNNFSIESSIDNINFIKRLFNVPIEFSKPLTLNGFINSKDDKANILFSAPDLTVSGMHFSDTHLTTWTPEDRINSSLTTFLHDKNGKVKISVDCTANDNNLQSSISWDNKRANIFKGKLNTLMHFYTDLNGKNAMQMTIPQSDFVVGDTIWNIHSDNIYYEDNKLIVNNLDIGNENQHVYLDGVASKNLNDSITARLKNVNVAYIMELINFHSVEFAGNASGTATAHGVFGDLHAKAHLDVENFLFQYGSLGTLYVDATYSNEAQQIDIDAVADDSDRNGMLYINGNISPQRNDIDLSMKLDNTRLDFLQSFCDSFMKDVDMTASGNLRLHDTFKTINMSGKVVANGDFTLTPTNCRYTLDHDTITFIPNDIQFHDAPLKDKFGNTAYINGGIHHRYLGRIAYDLNITTMRLLVYDYPTLGNDSYCGHAVVNGDFSINGKGNELSITADATTLPDSYFIYNVSTPDAIASQDFITWGSVKQKDTATAEEDKNITDNKTSSSGNDRTNIRMTIMLNATPDFKLHLLMDPTTGDYIDFFGNGTLRISYYNKGAFEIFGNYGIDRGTYKMTIQNLLRRDFAFQKGSTVSFGGDPYNAALNLRAAYILNSVSLSDLNIGSSFKSNNVPVNCLMNITGTPAKPDIAFDLELPTLSTDAREMVYSVINSAEEMNQQVLYLLGIGRFYSQTNNNNEGRTTNQTSLAMQSFLSGTLSQQLNNVLSQVIGNRKWSIGANISPGNDGFNNAVYEGLLSGSLLNNRLIFSGQFGYRDNIQKNSQNFIGDFTLQYLLTPNGNLSLKVYNQSNDRYFTRNSLNTQGIGVVLQKEFGK